jgi:epoxide hydrolase-like predicted phosphatase
MKIRAIFVDFGGVIVRTEDQEPRKQQAERLGMTLTDLIKIVFESESSRQASLGEITEEAHLQAVCETLGINPAESAKIVAEFFAGDQVNVRLLNFLRSLRPEYKICLISNAWSGLRASISRLSFEDVFDEMIISAEVGLVKPDLRIFQKALERIGVKPEESVFVDDWLRNVEAARSIGINAIQFIQPEETLNELQELLNNQR